MKQTTPPVRKRMTIITTKTRWTFSGSHSICSRALCSVNMENVAAIIVSRSKVIAYWRFVLAGQGCCQPKALLITCKGDTIISFSCTSQGYVSDSGFSTTSCVFTHFQGLPVSVPCFRNSPLQTPPFPEWAGHGTLLVIDQWRCEGSSSLFSEGSLSLLHWFLDQPVVGNCFWASGQTEVFSQMLISGFLFLFIYFLPSGSSLCLILLQIV